MAHQYLPEIFYDPCKNLLPPPLPTYLMYGPLLPHIKHVDNSIVLLLLAFETLGFIFSVFFYTLNNMIALFYT